jgi:hypothetical protein
MEETDYTQWIEDYLDGNLTGSDLKSFEEKLLSEPEFEKEVKAQRMIRESFERAELKEFFKQIKEKTEGIAPAENKGPLSFGFLAIAASLILAIGISLFFLFKETTKDLNQSEFVAQSFIISVSEDSLRGINKEIRVEIIESENKELVQRSEKHDIEIEREQDKKFEKIKYELYYSFNDGILKLYLGASTLSSDQTKIFYNPFAEVPYMLEIQGKKYLLEENSGLEPRPLIEVQK